MGRAERPEIVDAEFEVVAPARPVAEMDDDERITIPIVVWRRSRFIGLCVIVAAVFAFIFIAGSGASADADRACVLIYEATKTHADLSVPDFCRSRLTHPDGYQPR